MRRVLKARIPLIVAALATFLPAVSAVAQEDHSEDYQTDPLGLIAHYDTTSYYPNIVDTVEVWICETGEMPQANLTVEQLTDNLRRAGIAEYFESLSAGRYQMRLVPGGTTAAGSLLHCRGQNWDKSTAALLAVPNLVDGWGFSPNWIRVSQTYPLNRRAVMAGFRDGLKDMNVVGIAAIMGRTLGWGSSFTGALPKSVGTVYADNPMDMTSDGNQGALHVGTIAVNRYAAGWITPEQVHVYNGGADQVVLNVDWEPGAQMIVLPSGEQGHFLSLGARVAKRHDQGIPKEGVEAYIVKHECDDGGYCWGANRRHIPWPHDTEGVVDETGYLRLRNPLMHVLGVGQSLEWNGITVTVTQRTGDRWTVAITDGTEPAPTTTVTTGQDWFDDDNGNTHEQDINRLAELGIAQGCSADPPRFCPDRSVTRAEMAAFVLRALNLDLTPERTLTFSDVPEGKWYTNYVHALAETGVDLGHNGLWRPTEPLTRLEMARWLTGLFPHLTPVPAQRGLFDDVARDDWATVEGLYRSGVTHGCSADPLRYCPDQPVTRAQMASFITRALR